MRKSTKPTTSASNAGAIELVSVKDNRASTSSRTVADHFGKTHRNVTRAIATLLGQTGDAEFNALNFEHIEYLDSRGRKQTEWLMSEQGFALLAMGFTGPKAVALRLSFIKAFEAATQRIRELESRQAEPGWKVARTDTKIGHHLIGFALKTSRQIAGKDTAVFHYQNEAKLIRHAMTGTQEPLCRDCLSRDELKILARVEHANAEMIAVGEGYPMRKAKCRLLALQLSSDLERRGRSLLERNGFGRGRGRWIEGAA